MDIDQDSEWIGSAARIRGTKMQATNAMQATNEMQKCLRNGKNKVIGNYYVHFDYDDDMLRINLEEMFQKGADLNHLEKERGFGCIPHVFWCSKLIRFFLEKGADLHARDENGDTALHLAIRHRYNSRMGSGTMSAIQFLLFELNADPTVTNLRGETALFTLAKDIILNLDVLKMLLEKGANLETCNLNGESALHVYHRSDHLIKLYNGDVDLKTSNWLYSQTPLMAAAKNGSLDCCKALILKGANVNCRDLQGYTALHHAVLSGAMECAEFLAKKGADTKIKSESGIRDAYDLGVYRRYGNPFTFGAESARLAEIHEISGAMSMMRDQDRYSGIEQWDKVKEICSKLNRTILPSLSFLTNYNFLKENPDASEDEVHLSSVYAVSRLSKGISKFWNLLPFTREYKTPHYYVYVFKNLEFLSEDLKWVGYFASFEEADFESLLLLVKFFDKWLKKLVDAELKKDLASSDRISHLHSVARLVLACFTRRINETKSNKVSETCLELYVEQCRVLTSIHAHFRDAISATAFTDNERLLKNLVELDLRDRDDNSLTHIVLKNEGGSKFNSDSLFVLLDFLNITTSRNRMGFEPIQCIKWDNWRLNEGQVSEVLLKLANRGAHVDARNAWGGPSLGNMFEKENFKPYLTFGYDNLKCACARVLAKNLVPYRNRVPQRMIDFIQAHMQ